MKIKHETTELFEVLYNETHEDFYSRYKIFYGGRGGRKSWEIATALILRAYQKKTLILCTREIQNSINDSVLSLLSNTVERLKLSAFFEIQKTTIICKHNGSEFKFKGLNGMTIDSIKSFEGVDYCWVEEAHSVSKKSWDVLIPTIRKEGSEIWVSFNPDLATDPVYERFILEPPEDTFVQKVSYLDNPDCPQTLIKEANYLKRVNEDLYNHIYLGEIRDHSEHRIFKWKPVSFEEFNAIQATTYYGVDWGKVDPWGIVAAKYHDGRLFVHELNYSSENETMDNLSQTQILALREHEEGLVKWMFEKLNIPKDAIIVCDNNRREKVRALRVAGWESAITARKGSGSIIDGIYSLSQLEVFYTKGSSNIEMEQLLYSWEVDRYGLPTEKPTDKNNHTIDPIRYIVQFLITQGVVNVI